MLSESEIMSDLFCVTETIEDGKITVTASPELWVKDQYILLWPPGPGPVDRSKPCPPQDDWTPIMCKVLKDSIATYEEAIELEQRYSKHRNSDSFRAAETRKQLKRKHPVNASEHMKSDLIDLNSLVSKIDQKQGKIYKDVVPKMKSNASKPNKYHSLCKEKYVSKSKPQDSHKQRRLNNVPLKSKSNLNSQSNVPELKKDSDIVNEPKKPRYENYLKSGRKNIAVEKGNTAPPPLMRIRKTEISSTITKEQFLKQKALTKIARYKEEEPTALAMNASTPITQIEGRSLEDATENANNGFFPRMEDCFENLTDAPNDVGMENILSSVTNVDNIRLDETTSDSAPKNIAGKIEHNKFSTGLHSNIFTKTVPSVSGRSIPTVDVIENLLIKPARITQPPMCENFQNGDNIGTAILSSLDEMKIFFKQSEQSRMRFEARMQKQWEIFAKKVLLAQGQNDGFGEFIDDSDDFEDLDENFPIEFRPYVEELDWNIQKDLQFKRRMKNRLDLLGGNDEKAAVRSKMKYLVSDTVLDLYTWKGTPKKRPFENLIFLNGIIFRSVRSEFKKYIYKQYSSYMVQWLKHSFSRQRTVTYQYPARNPPVARNETTTCNEPIARNRASSRHVHRALDQFIEENEDNHQTLRNQPSARHLFRAQFNEQNEENHKTLRSLASSRYPLKAHNNFNEEVEEFNANF